MSKLLARFARFLFETHDARRMRKQTYDTSDLRIQTDIPYIADGTEEHLLDIYRPKQASTNLPTIVNIHGGALVASYKNVNSWFNHEWARRGYAVVSLNYRHLPQTTLIHQVEDIMSALSFLSANRNLYGLNLDHCYITGDSAGALLAFFVLSLEGSRKLRDAFCVKSSGITFRAAGLISIMLDTQRHDLAAFLNDIVSDAADSGKPYLPFILNPTAMLQETHLPPLCLVTSDEDIIQKDTLKFDKSLTEAQKEHRLLNFGKSKGKRLEHVFAVQYPMWQESRQVYEEIDSFFRQQW